MVVDASVWVASLLPQDIYYQASADWIDRQFLAGESLVIPSLALPEVAGAISRRTQSRDRGHRAIAFLTSSTQIRQVSLDPVLSEEAARIAVDYQLRGADAVYAALARALALPLYTWDQELLQRAAPLVVVRTP